MAEGLVEVTVPQAGTESGGAIEEILHAVGDTVSAGEAVIVIEMDKAAVEIEAPVDGEIAEILVKKDQEIVPGDVLFRLRPLGGGQ